MEIWEIVAITFMWSGSGAGLSEIATSRINRHFNTARDPGDNKMFILGVFFGPVFGLLGLIATYGFGKAK